MLGCSGSVTGPDSPASGYLLTAPDAPPLVIDFGGGVLGSLQRFADPGSVSVLLSHLHADHCLDLPGLFVWRRYHPNPPKGKAIMYGPADTLVRVGAASAEIGGEVDDFTDIFDVFPWADGEPVQFGSLTVTPTRVAHPPESYGLRIEDSSGTVLAYSGDTGTATPWSIWHAVPMCSCVRRHGRTCRGTARRTCTCREPRRDRSPPGQA